MKSIYAIMFFLAFSSFAQPQPQAILVDEFGEVCSEDLMARMDNFFIQLNNNPSASGVVIFHGRKDAEGRNIKLADYIRRRYPNQRGFDLARLNLIRAENREEQLIRFWLIPPLAQIPNPDQLYVVGNVGEPVLFDRAWADFNRWSGALDIYQDGFFDLGCDFSPNRSRFTEIIKENKKLDAFLIVYSASANRRRGLRIASFALNDLVKNFRVPRSRVRAIYGGMRKEPEIEFWLVPRGQPRPKARPNLPPIRNF